MYQAGGVSLCSDYAAFDLVPLCSTTSHVSSLNEMEPQSFSDTVKKFWNPDINMAANFTELGLVSDPNMVGFSS